MSDVKNDTAAMDSCDSKVFKIDRMDNYRSKAQSESLKLNR